MRKLAVGLALASTALSAPAFARDGQWYVTAEGGAMIVEDSDFDIDNSAALVGGSGTLDHEKGYDFGGLIGYDFGAFRLEAEGSYRRANDDTYFTDTVTPFGMTPGISRSGGKADAVSFMLNAMLDIGADDGIQGFIGGGAGIARVRYQSIVDQSNGNFLNDKDTGFAWQGIAGVRAPLSDNVDVGLKYRFFNADKVNLVDQGGRGIDTRFRSHSLLGSITYNFGGEPEPLPVVAPPPVAPPPPAPAPSACNEGPYLVFFDWDESNIRPDAATVLDNAVAQYANCGMARVMLAGHADKSGSAQYNVGLSQRRNTSVRAYLESRGIGGANIASEAFGETQPRVDTADGVREPQNRRVEITYGPGSGM